MRFLRILFFIAVTLLPVGACAAYTQIIKMTDAGFEPTDVTIAKDTTVQFVNAGSTAHWPASNIHPTHSVYPGSGIEKCGTSEELQIFDACGGIKPGDSYSFRFSFPGEWRFHDHLNPTHTGTIKVTGTPGVPQAEKVSLWKEIRSSVVTMIHRLKRAIFPGSVAAEIENIDMFALVKDHAALVQDVRDFGGKALMLRLIEQSKGGTLQDCHQEAHKLGRAAYEVQGKEAFKEGDSSCHSGFYHGAMESFLRERGTSNLAESIKSVCDSFPTSFSRFECLHGVGHGILAYEDYDLPKAITTCKDLHDQFSVSSCYGGVFMENIVTGQGIGAVGSHSTSWVNKTDPQFPCTAVASNPDALYQCYLMQTSWMLTISNYDFDWTAKQCLNATPSMIDTCYQSLGRDAAGYTLRDPQKIVTICNSVPKNKRYRCIVGAVNVIVDFWGEKLEGQASALCRLANDGKDACFSTLASRLPELFPDKESKAKVCATLDSAYQPLCK